MSTREVFFGCVIALCATILITTLAVVAMTGDRRIEKDRLAYCSDRDEPMQICMADLSQ